MKTVHVVYGITILGKLVYIGRTNNFRRRQCEHLRNIYQGKGARRFRKVFRRIRCDGQWHNLDFHIVYDGSPREVRRVEKALILKHRPPANTEFLDPDHEKLKYQFVRNKYHQYKNQTRRRIPHRRR